MAASEALPSDGLSRMKESKHGTKVVSKQVLNCRINGFDAEQLRSIVKFAHHRNGNRDVAIVECVENEHRVSSGGGGDRNRDWVKRF